MKILKTYFKILRKEIHELSSAFGYFADDYGLNACAQEREAILATRLGEMANLARELGEK
jgi:hypothetical protein